MGNIAVLLQERSQRNVARKASTLLVMVVRDFFSPSLEVRSKCCMIIIVL
ncbi:hypothetical protein BDA96_03G327400 [Sorghum bicolor]|uniref:Uncharacterized protein n=1 Tax=Sorghum bicolor TaxID=4558 RepID=A0A921RI33_SORBI|nr:hypothetical protein BDA96_03G327400 [Sorghum bicolor]